MSYHDPVLLVECLKGLKIVEGGVYVDVTFGGGGHSKEIMKSIGAGRLVGFDQDASAVVNRVDDDRFDLVEQNFRFLKNNLRMIGAYPVNGLLADLGVSSHQFDTAERGFSTRFDGELDMRMNGDAVVSASDVINTYSEEDLLKMFWQYGDVSNARKLVRNVLQARSEAVIDTVQRLKAVASKSVNTKKEHQYMAKVFQAIRIEVNDELGALKEMLEQCTDVIAEGGRLVVISYHSLEDKLVKSFMRTGNFEAKEEKDFYGNVIRPFNPVNRKVIIPSEEEIAGNNRARSAKLRVAERI